MTCLTILGPFGLGGVASGIIGIVAIILLALLVVQVFYLLTLQKAMQQVSPDLRRMEPGLVWLMFIPLFSLVWNFIMVGKIADSLGDEFRRRNIPVSEERPGYSIGLWMCILSLAGCIRIIPVSGMEAIGGLTGLGGFVCWIIYWVKIKGYKEMLENSSQYQQFQQHPYEQQQYQQNPYQQNPYQNPNQNPNEQNPYQNPGNTPPPYQGPQ